MAIVPEQDGGRSDVIAQYPGNKGMWAERRGVST